MESLSASPPAAQHPTSTIRASWYLLLFISAAWLPPSEPFSMGPMGPLNRNMPSVTRSAYISTKHISKSSNRDRFLGMLTSTRTSCARRVGAAALRAQDSDEKKKVVVVGAGWAGLGCAHHLSKIKGVEVTLLDSAPQPGGLVSGWKTAGGRSVEAGIHGFWDEYHNIFQLVDSLQLNEDPFTGYAKQGQYSPRGLEAIWPVYRDQNQLPTGAGQAIYTQFLRMPPWDMATAAPMALALADFDQSPEAWERWDKVSFLDMCRELGVSDKMYKEAFEPMILTGLFAPGEQCSAAAAMGMAYFFVLKHQNSFDVRWCRGSVRDLIFAPWVQRLSEQGVTFLTNKRVTDLDIKDRQVQAVRCSDGAVIEADAVVLAVGIAAAQSIVAKSEVLGSFPEFASICNLAAVDALAVRLWLDRRVDVPYKTNACWGFDRGVGMTFFDLTKLQAPIFDQEPGTVVEVDFYHANTLLSLSEDAMADRALSHLKKALPDVFEGVNVIDKAVVKLPRAVSWFFPGSYQDTPGTRSKNLSNVCFAGDWIRTNHGSWSQEKAYVTGLAAAQETMNQLNIPGQSPVIIPLKDDEPHVAAARRASKMLRNLGLPSPFRV